MNNNVSVFNKKNLCIQCGTCESICPERAVKVKEYGKKGLLYPHIEEKICAACGLCLKVCPVSSFSLKSQPIKTYRNIGIFFSPEKKDEKDMVSPSGGIVSAILRYLFTEKKIDKALVTIMDQKNNLNPKGIIIRGKDEVKKAEGSVYAPVALNKELDKITKYNKLAYVGLPCHVKGLINYLSIKKNFKPSEIIKIGLLCNIGRSKNATRFLIKKYAKKATEIRGLHYRKGPYPGSLHIYTKKETIVVPYKEFMARTVYFFPPKGCLFCDDLFNEQADISIGDPWGMVNRKKALLIARSQEGQSIIDDMEKSGDIKEEKRLSRKSAILTQNYKHKKNRLYRAALCDKIKISIPPNIKNELANYKDVKASTFGKMLSIALLINSIFFNSRLYMLAKFIPLEILNKLSSYVKKKYKRRT